jgi:S1-C subfamily serine protease
VSFDLLDLAIVALATAAAVGGWRLGLAARAASWVGMVLGILAATRILPAILRWQRGGRQDQVLAIFFIVLIGGAFIGQLIGLVIGTRLRLAIPPGPLRSADRAGGAVAGAIGVLFSFWLLLPSMADIPEWPAREARNSAIAAVLHDHLPRPPDAVLALRQLVGEDVYPRVFESLDAAPDLGPPPAESGLTKETADKVAASTVKVESTACGRIVEGSGSVVGADLIETNAHVVAGGSAVTVVRHPDGVALNAEVVAFDPNRDLAILHVPGIDRPALPVRGSGFGDGGVGAVFGHPLGGPLRLAPFKVGSEVTANGRDIYDSHTTQRHVFILASNLQPGDSGSALVNPAGEVVGVAFAIAPDRADVAYALTDEELQPVLASDLSHPVSTGPCLG